MNQIEMELGMNEESKEDEELQMRMEQLKQIRVLVIEIYGKLCCTNRGIDSIIDNNSNYHYLAEDLPTISSITDFNKLIQLILQNIFSSFHLLTLSHSSNINLKTISKIIKVFLNMAKNPIG